MNDLTIQPAFHLSAAEQLERSVWFGTNLLTFLATPEETGGAFTLIKHTMCQGFEPPLHVHTREDENHLLLDGEIEYHVGGKRILAQAGDYVQMPRSIPHRFKVLSDTVTLLLIITPSGFEKMFRQFSRPAPALELPPVPTEQPGKAFFEAMNELNAQLGVTMLPEL